MPAPTLPASAAACCIPPNRAGELKPHPTSRGHTMSNHRTINPSRVLSRLPRLGRRAGTWPPLRVPCCSCGGAPDLALAVSTRDLIELSKAGLGDEVLVALIEADGTVFNLDAPENPGAPCRRRERARHHGDAQERLTPSPATSPVAADPRPRCCATACARRNGTARRTSSSSARNRRAAHAPGTDLHPSLDALLGGHQATRAVRPAKPMIEYRGFGRFINDGWIDNTRR